MSKERINQSKYAQLVGKLINFAYAQGYELTIGDAWRPDRKGHVPDSYHYIRLAIDLNLFVNGNWIENYSPEWQILGDYWKSLDPECTWGGDFKKKKDYDHFSYGER